MGALSRKVSDQVSLLESVKTDVEQVEKQVFRDVFLEHFLIKQTKRETWNRLGNRNTFYWILGIPVIEKKGSGGAGCEFYTIIMG